MSASKHPDSRSLAENTQGFILLEVLVAMSMILGVWITSVGAYQRLALNLIQQELKRSQLRKDLDAFEMQEHGRFKFNSSNEVLRNDSNRVPSRSRSMHTTSQPTFKDKR